MPARTSPNAIAGAKPNSAAPAPTPQRMPPRPLPGPPPNPQPASTSRPALIQEHPKPHRNPDQGPKLTRLLRRFCAKKYGEGGTTIDCSLLPIPCPLSCLLHRRMRRQENMERRHRAPLTKHTPEPQRPLMLLHNAPADPQPQPRPLRRLRRKERLE